jgi:hypothetical protein
MKSTIIMPDRVIQVKENPVLVSNMLEFKAIEKYKAKHPELSLNDAAIQWIDRNAAAWRAKHPMEILTGR